MSSASGLSATVRLRRLQHVWEEGRVGVSAQQPPVFGRRFTEGLWNAFPKRSKYPKSRHYSKTTSKDPLSGRPTLHVWILWAHVALAHPSCPKGR